MHRVNSLYVRKLFKHSRLIDSSILFITHAGCNVRQIDELLLEVEKYIKFDKIILQKASATVSGNCGVGTFGLMFVRKPVEDKSSSVQSSAIFPLS